MRRKQCWSSGVSVKCATPKTRQKNTIRPFSGIQCGQHASQTLPMCSDYVWGRLRSLAAHMSRSKLINIIISSHRYGQKGQMIMAKTDFSPDECEIWAGSPKDGATARINATIWILIWEPLALTMLVYYLWKIAINKTVRECGVCVCVAETVRVRIVLEPEFRARTKRWWM